MQRQWHKKNGISGKLMELGNILISEITHAQSKTTTYFYHTWILDFNFTFTKWAVICDSESIYSLRMKSGTSQGGV